MKELNQRQLQAKATRLKITKAAMTLLRSTPYDSIKIADICKLADISIGGFYHYFDSKEMIIIDAYNIIDEKVMNKYKKNTPENPIDKIIYLNECIAMVATSLGSKLVSNCYRQLLVDDSNYTASPDRLVHQILKGILVEGINQGLIKDTDTALLTEYLNKIARGNIFDWCVKRGSFDLKDVLAKEIKDVLSLFIIK